MSQVNNIQGVAYVKNNKDSIDKLVDLTGKIKMLSFILWFSLRSFRCLLYQIPYE